MRQAGLAALVLLVSGGCFNKPDPPGPAIRFRGEVSDPAGDAIAHQWVARAPDLVHAIVRVTDDSVLFSVRFAPRTFDSTTTGITIQLDTDLDPSTGIRMEGLGVDYVVSLGHFTGTKTLLARASNGPNCPAPAKPCTFATVVRGPAAFHADGVDGAIPRAAFERLDGRLNFRVLAYVRLEGEVSNTVTDWMPDYQKPPAVVR